MPFVFSHVTRRCEGCFATSDLGVDRKLGHGWPWVPPRRPFRSTCAPASDAGTTCSRSACNARSSPSSNHSRHQKVAADPPTEFVDPIQELRQKRVQPGGKNFVDVTVLQRGAQAAGAALGSADWSPPTIAKLLTTSLRLACSERGWQATGSGVTWVPRVQASLPSAFANLAPWLSISR